MQREIAQKFSQYPTVIAQPLLKIREMILDQAQALGIDDLQETLKWGQPSYLCKGGSTIRLGGASGEGALQKSTSYSIYFNCNSLLVETFRELYPTEFTYIGNREIQLKADQTLPESALRHCLSMALRYHKLKQLPLLGGFAEITG